MQIAVKTAMLQRARARRILIDKRLEFKLPPLPESFHELNRPSRYKVFYGGRGAGKSWQFARKLVEISHTRRVFIVCTRQMQTSIKDSVHRLLTNQIRDMGLSQFFKITQHSITHLLTRSEFVFKGLNHLVTEIKSLEGADYCWVAEAQNVSDEAWKVLIPTVRRAGSEIWAEFNTDLDDDPTYKRFVLNTPPDCILRLVNYYDNPFFPEVLEKERAYTESLIARARDDMERAQAQADYDNIWMGATSQIKQSAIFRSKVVIEEFETPQNSVFYHGADFGFASDPATLIRCFITDSPDGSGRQDLWIDEEVFGYGVDIDLLPAMYEHIQTSRKWGIKADNSRPDTISYLAKQGFIISAARKWSGSVEDGIEHIKGFRVIHIHRRCIKMAEEARNYCYKVDKKTDKILPVVVDAWNHGWDALRYALDDFIKARGGLALWENLYDD